MKRLTAIVAILVLVVLGGAILPAEESAANPDILKTLPKELHFAFSEFTMEVNYDVPILDYIRAGKYDEIVLEEDRYAECPRVGFGTKKVVAKMWVPKDPLCEDDTIAVLDKTGYRTANLWELCAFGLGCPEFQRHLGIASLFRFVSKGGSEFSPYLGGEYPPAWSAAGKNPQKTRNRILGLRKSSPKVGSCAGYIFLVVKK